ADQTAIDVDGAPAYSGDDARVCQRPALELRENEVAPRPDDVFEHADDVDLEFLDTGPVEHGAADAHHPRADLVDAHVRRRGAKPREGDRTQGEDEAKTTEMHGSNPLFG